MLSAPEKHSLQLIFERVSPDKVSGLIETLSECLRDNYQDARTKEIIGILNRAAKKIEAQTDHLPQMTKKV